MGSKFRERFDDRMSRELALDIGLLVKQNSLRVTKKTLDRLSLLSVVVLLDNYTTM